MTQAHPSEALALVSAVVEDARRILAGPGEPALDRSLAQLEQARDALERLATGGDTIGPAAADKARESLRALRGALGALRIRLEFAADFYGGWLRLRDTITSGYTADGGPPPAAGHGRLLAEG